MSISGIEVYHKIEEFARQREKEILDKAKLEEQYILHCAKVERERIIAEAKLEANAMIENAKLEAQRAKEVIELARQEQESQEAKKVSEQLVRKYFTEDRIEFKASLERDIATITKENKEILGRAEQIHEQMCDQTNGLQAVWINALTSATEQLSKMKDDFYKHLHTWQVGLYPHELRPLAERYIDLYRIINVERLLSEEILFHYINKQTDDTSNEVEISQTTLVGLRKLNRTLTTFLHKFETSLSGLGLYVFYPSVGDVFDDVWHVLENETLEYDNNKITRCVVPGIAKKVNGATEDDVIIPAIVSL